MNLDILEGIPLREVCLLVGCVAAFIALLLTIIHYISRALVGMTIGAAAQAGVFGSMMQDYFRDILIPFVVSVGAFLIMATSHLYEIGSNWVVEQGFERFLRF